MNPHLHAIQQKARDEQDDLTPEQNEDQLWGDYDALWGALVVNANPYTHHLVEKLDHLLGVSLLSIPDYQGERAETADLKTMSHRQPGAASTASSGLPSGVSRDKASRDLSWNDKETKQE